MVYMPKAYHYPTPSLGWGAVVSSHAWALRRMVSTYNAITRRPHVPRERALRQIMADQGLGVEVDPPPRSSPSSGSVGAIANGPNDPDSSDDDPSDDSDSDHEPSSLDEGEESETDLDDELVCFLSGTQESKDKF